MTQDDELVLRAKDAIRSRFRPDWHVIGAALRLRTGETITGIHLEANVCRVAVCAEAIGLGCAVTELGSSVIETIVADYHAQNGQIDVVASCGMCREMISDYSSTARLVMPDEAKITVDHGDVLAGPRRICCRAVQRTA